MNLTASPAVNGTTKLDKKVTPQAVGAPRPNWSISDRWDWACGLPVSGIARAVAGCIARHANDKTGVSGPSMGTIAAETGFCRTAVVAAIKVLELAGHVKIRRLKVVRDGHLVNIANRYQLPPMGGQEALGGSASDALGGSASDDRKQVHVRTYPPQDTKTPALPEHLEAVEAGHGVKCRRCSHMWPRAAGLSHMCVGRSERAAHQHGPKRGMPDYTLPQQEGGDHGGGDRARPTAVDANLPPDGYRGSRVRNCPQCHAEDRGHEDTCQHCSWTRAAWDARSTDGTEPPERSERPTRTRRRQSDDSGGIRTGIIDAERRAARRAEQASP